MAIARKDAAKLKSMQTVIPTDTVLFAEDDTSTQMYILINGKVGIYKGESLIAELSEAGTYFGEMSTLLQAPRTATVKTLVTSTFYEVPQSKVDEFFRHSPDMAIKLAKILAQRLADMNHKFVQLQKKYTEMTIAGVSADEAKMVEAGAGADAPVVPAPSAETPDLDKVLKSDLHKAILQIQIAGVGSKTTIKELGEKTKGSAGELSAVLNEFAAYGLVYVENDDVYFLEAIDDSFREALKKWGEENKGS